MWIQERAPMAADVETSHTGVAPDPGRLRSWVERMAVPRHISANARQNARVRDEVASAFEGHGLAVHIQGRYQNVVALPRCEHGTPLTFIAAHYDSVPDCPGADDNASGLAVMLECAGLLAEAGCRAPVGFIAFNAEEDGLAGSRDFVAHGLADLSAPVRLAHVLEMVGFRRPPEERQRLPLPWTPKKLQVPDFIGLIAKGRSNRTVDRVRGSSAAPGLRLVTAKTWGPMHTVLPHLKRSDHFAFWTAGVPAILWTDTANFRNPNYHQVTDTPETLDYAFMGDVAELLCATVAADVPA